MRRTMRSKPFGVRPDLRDSGIGGSGGTGGVPVDFLPKRLLLPDLFPGLFATLAASSSSSSSLSKLY